MQFSTYIDGGQNQVGSEQTFDAMVQNRMEHNRYTTLDLRIKELNESIQIQKNDFGSDLSAAMSDLP